MATPAPTIAEHVEADETLFDGGPPMQIEERLGLRKPGDPRVRRRAIVAALLAWGPLALLTALHGDFLGTEPGHFLVDFGSYARFLIALPLLIVAQSIVAPRMGNIARHFLDAGFVTAADRGRFTAAVESTLRLRDSAVVEVLVVVLAYALVGGMAASVPADDLPVWHGAGGRFTPAGWWHVAVSLPVLFVLFLGWMWRLALWARFLAAMSRLDLQLVPAHPDQAAGLRFVGYSVRVAGPVGFAFGAIGAGRVANTVFHHGASILDSRFLIGGLVAVVLVLFTSPLLVFTGSLMTAWRRGVKEYGALASAEGRVFERKWCGPPRAVDQDALSSPDFSATTDLYQVVANVYAMRFIPIDTQSVVSLAVTTLLPFVPVVLMTVPLNVLLEKITHLLM